VRREHGALHRRRRSCLGPHSFLRLAPIGTVWDLSQESADVRALVRAGVLSRERLYAEIGEIVSGGKRGREGSERIVVRAEGMANQHIALAAWTYHRAVERG
jgi:N-[(2S)-2-amino-2-carboxyethyl]-L-glutamate dehydrogenase